MSKPARLHVFVETAVMASCLLNRIAAKARHGKDQTLHTSIKEHSEVFAQRSFDLLTILYEEKPEDAMKIIVTECTVWDIDVMPLECAYDNVMLDFISHSCVQRSLNKIWYEDIGATLGDFWWNGLFCGCKKVSSNTSQKLPNFFKAPLTRFLVHYILFTAALVGYSTFLLFELSDYEDAKSIKIYEWLIYIWLVGDIIEEYRRVIPWKERFSVLLSKEKKDGAAPLSQNMKYKLFRYFYDFWNALDVCSYLVTLAAILVRFFKESSRDDSGTGSYIVGARLARRLYSLSLFTMYMRFLHALLMSRKLGPKIIMIKEMLKDLFRFIGILFVFMIGVGVLYHANMYPAHYDMWNRQDWTYWRIWKIMYIPYWQIYGELFLEEFQANSTTPCTTVQSEWESNPDFERCNEYDWVLIVIAALYLLISNLLLVNLVIALFSYRFEIVQANSEKLWRYWRYSVIKDYNTRIPAPLNLVIRPFIILYKCFKMCRNCCNSNDVNNNGREIERMQTRQDICVNKCIRLTEKTKQRH